MYYVLACGYSGVTATIQEHCKACGGTGEVQVKRFKSARCKACRGEHSGTPIGPFPIELSECTIRTLPSVETGL